MAPRTRVLSLNLGTHTVGLGQFRALPNGGLVLDGYRLREILADPANEAERNAQIVIALREMLGELGIKRGAVNYATAAQTVFAPIAESSAIPSGRLQIRWKKKRTGGIQIPLGLSATTRPRPTTSELHG